MDEPKMGFFSRIYYSIAGFSKYRYFLRQDTSRAVVYLVIISLVLGIVSFIPAVQEYNKIIDDVIANFNTMVPDFKLENGKLTVNGKMPIVLDEGGSPLVIDTTPGAEDRILSQYDIVILITSDKIIQKNYVNKTVTSLGSFQGIIMTRDNIRQALPVMKPLGIFIFFFGGIFFIAGKFISVLIVSLIGLIINAVMKINLSYRSIFKISIYSLTLPLIISTLLSLIPAVSPFVWLIFYLIAAVYVFGAMHSIKKEIDAMTKNMNMS